MSSKPDGYRYVRQYRQGEGARRAQGVERWTRWQLWEVREGTARRVGTATTEGEYRAFLDGSTRA